MVFLFNVGGYYIVFWGLQQRYSRELIERLDANLYSEEETIELKIPVTLPYPLNQQEFERVNGKFEHNGEYYKLVKQKLHNDTLYIVCIQDHQQKRLEKTITEYANLSNDLPSNSDKALNFLGKLLKDFESNKNLDLVASGVWCLEIPLTFHSFKTIDQEREIHSPPPKV